MVAANTAEAFAPGVIQSIDEITRLVDSQMFTVMNPDEFLPVLKEELKVFTHVVYQAHIHRNLCAFADENGVVRSQGGYLNLARINAKGKAVRHRHAHFCLPTEADSAIILNEKDRCNQYISVNAFISRSRRTRELFAVTGFMIDFDSHDDEPAVRYAKIRNTLDAVYTAVFNGQIPAPTTVVFTGRGIQMMFSYEHSISALTADKKQNPAVKLHKKLSRAIFDEIASVLDESCLSLDISCLDLSRVMRFPGSMNIKVWSPARLLWAPASYVDFQAAVEQYLPEYDPNEKKTKKKRGKKKNKKKKNKNGNSWRAFFADLAHLKQNHELLEHMEDNAYIPLGFSRISVLSQLLEYAVKNNMQITGYRHTLLFGFANNAFLITGDLGCAHRFINYINAQLPIRLCSEEVASIISSLQKKGSSYPYKSSSFIERILKPVADVLGCPVPQYTSPHLKKLKADSARQRKLKKMSECFILYQSGASKADIAKKLKVHRNTVRNWLTNGKAEEAYAQLHPEYENASTASADEDTIEKTASKNVIDINQYRKQRAPQEVPSASACQILERRMCLVVDESVLPTPPRWTFKPPRLHFSGLKIPHFNTLKNRVHKNGP